ncbi:MAG TPA: hypothetical protein VNX29_12895 [Kaistia sp.]|nr:hypothetical protein [Kaistia sp.]
MSDLPSTKERSPSFPFISLPTAVDRLKAFESTFGRHPAPADKAGMAWSMNEKSSQAYQTLAAMKAFGLIDYQGIASARKALISESGRDLLRAQQDSVKQKILKASALRPKQIRKFWSDWGADRPPDAVCLDQLVLENGFTVSAANNFLKVYDATISFAGLNNADALQAMGIPSDQEEYDKTEPDDSMEATEGLDSAVTTRASTPYRQISRRSGREERTSLDEGEAVLFLPESLSSDSVEDLEYWLQGILRKEKRRAGTA